MKIQKLAPDKNPYPGDGVKGASRVSLNLMILHENPMLTEESQFIILMNPLTGERFRLSGFDDMSTLEVDAGG